MTDDGDSAPDKDAAVKKAKNAPSDPIGNTFELSSADTLGAIARNVAPQVRAVPGGALGANSD